VTGWAAVGIAVALLGVLLVSPPVVFIGGTILLIRVLTEVWPRHVLESLVYDREIAHPRTVVGDPVEVRVSLWNRTRLPIARAMSSDSLPVALTAAGSRPRSGAEPETLQLSATLRPYERVTRRYRVTPLRRGVHEIGPVRLGVAELFGSHAPQRDPEIEPHTIVARPWTAPLAGTLPADAPLAGRKAKRSLFVDQNLFAGVRPYQAGDPARSVHWRASARQGRLQTKKYEPSLSGQSVLVLDVQTVEGPYWLMIYDEPAFEDLAVATLSVARALVTHETAVGFAAAGYSGSMQRYIFLPARADRPQVGRIGDALARLTPESSAPLVQLLAWLPRRVAGGTTLVVLSARDPVPNAAVVRRLVESGFPVHFVLLNVEHVEGAHKAGLSAWTARVESEAGLPRAVVVGA
jgi:uncharacterized protein (DUF58 family)